MVFISFWESSILLKQNDGYINISKTDHEIMIFDIPRNKLYCKLKIIYYSKSNYQNNVKRVGRRKI